MPPEKLRSPKGALADLRAKMKSLPLNHPERPALARMIVRLEDEIEDRDRTKLIGNAGALC